MHYEKGNDPSDILEVSLEKIESLLKGDYGISKRSIGLLLLQGDSEIAALVKAKDGDSYSAIEKIANDTKAHYHDPLSYIIALRRQEEVNRIAGLAIEHPPKSEIGFRERLSRVMINPLTGLPILLLILYYGLYK